MYLYLYGYSTKLKRASRRAVATAAGAGAGDAIIVLCFLMRLLLLQLLFILIWRSVFVVAVVAAAITVAVPVMLCCSVSTAFLVINHSGSDPTGPSTRLIHSCLYSVKCYAGVRKIHFIPSISEILSQKCFHCVQYTRRHRMSLFSHC